MTNEKLAFYKRIGISVYLKTIKCPKCKKETIFDMFSEVHTYDTYPLGRRGGYEKEERYRVVCPLCKAENDITGFYLRGEADE